MISVTVAGRTRQYEPGVTAREVLKDTGALVARIDGRLVDLATPLDSDCAVEPVLFDSEEGREVYWHSTSHLLAQAVKQLFPDARELRPVDIMPDGEYADAPGAERRTRR